MARPRPAHPDRVFLTIAATAAFVSTLVFTIAPVYRFRTAGLDDLQLVLVGTVLEAAVFVFEIPTGVVADRWSRKWSVIIGHAGIGLGLLIEATFATFPACSPARRSGASPTRSRVARPSRGWPASSVTPIVRCFAGCSCGPASWARPARSSPCRRRSRSAS